MIGQRFGNYRAMALLGEGGMGSVYLAEHPEIGRRVAVKVLRPEYTKNPELLGRFLNEARAANAIRHPNIIEILDSGTIEGGAPYLVMELLEGETISDRIKRLGKLSLPEALEFAYQTASAVGAAHKKGIVHRDLKPDNLFIVPDASEPGRERVKVLDFGIAKLAQHGPGDSVKTRTGTLMGTPIYMSPEQCLGTREVDQRSDVYALGVILFEMLTGRPPFVSEGFGELVNMHLNMEPPSARTVNPQVPAAIDAVVLKCLSKRPEDRIESMAGLQAALKAAAGPTLLIRGASSPNLNGGTIPTINGNGKSLMTPPRPADDRPPSDRAPFRSTLGLSPTTLPDGSAEPNPQTLVVRHRKLLWLVGSLAAIGGVATVGFTLLAGRGSVPASIRSAGLPATGPASGPEAPQVARIMVSSQPAGARVVRVDDGAVLGVTPLELNLPVTSRPLALRLKLDGFQDAETTVLARGDHTEAVTMVPMVAPPAAVPAVEKPLSPTPKSPHRHHGPIAPADSDEPAKL